MSAEPNRVTSDAVRVLRPTMALRGLSEDDIQEWLDEKNPAELVNALYQALEPPAWADELCNPAAPTTTPPPHMFTKCMQRPHIPAWPKTAIGDAEVGTLFVGTPPLRADALPPKRPRDDFEWSHTSEEQQHEEQQHSPSIHNEKQFARMAARREFMLREMAVRPPPGNKFSQKRSERASKRPRGPRGRYLPHDEIAVV